MLGISELMFLDYRDQELDRANPREALARIVFHLRRTRPDVVLSFGPEGAYGHPDHIAICQYTTAAVSVADGLIDDARVFVGSVGPKPQRMTAVEDAIRGQKPGLVLFQESALLAANDTEIDEEGFESAAYKRHLVAMYLQKALQDAADKAKARQS